MDRLEFTKSFSKSELVIGAGAKPRLAVFTLTMDRLDYTKRMFESLDLCLEPGYLHVVIDQGSSDETPKYLYDRALDSRRPLMHVVCLNRNVGISAASNFALDTILEEYPSVEYIWKIDNDCELLTSDMDNHFISICQSVSNKIVLSPFVEGLRENKGGAPRYMMIESCNHPIGLSYHLGGICEFAHKDSYKEFRFDERDSLSGSQDSSYSSYVRNNGYLLGYVEDHRCAHMDTTDGQHKKYPEYFDRRRTYDSVVSSKEAME